MKRKFYPIHPDFKPISNLNPPLNRALLPAMQKAMGALWTMEKSGDGVKVIRLEIPLDKKKCMSALLYSPEGCSGNLPCLVYYHGGGFVFNAAPYHFLNAREYCRGAKCRVLFVNYRLAPAHKFPAALDDAFRAYRWIQMNSEKLGIDFYRIAVGGDSAGGNLASAVCLMARDYGAAVPCGQMLVYPCTDVRMETESVKRFEDTPMCNSIDMKKYIQFYIPHLSQMSMEERVYASPAEAESLKGMPAAYVETAEFDCLHDEGLEYANRLEGDGVDVTVHETKGTIHGYDFMSKSPIVWESLQMRIAFLRRIFYSAAEKKIE